MEHTRIDEGVKRGPRRKSVPRRRDPETDRVEGIPAHIDPNAVLEQYLTEKSTSHIAKDLGVKRKTLVAWLRAQSPERWKQVQVIRALARKEDADEELDTGCSDALSLARTREILKSAQWDLERLDSPTYGPKNHVTVEHVGDLAEKLRRARERIIDAVPQEVKSLTDQGADSADSSVIHQE